MEIMVKFRNKKNHQIFWKNKKVLVTGHSGFKGSWLTIWLNLLGAKIFGISLKPDYKPNNFQEAQVENLCKSYFIDILNYKKLNDIVNEIDPEIVFHLAAQPLVLESYNNPLKTLKTNIIGTSNLLESLKNKENIKVIIIVTSDKVYQYTKDHKSFKETDQLGGLDLYSASKASCEIIINAYKSSFLEKRNILISSVRAGNIIGGGDWSKNRIIPDVIKSIKHNKILEIRNANAVRPWQHVLEPIYGYINLARKMYLKEVSEVSFNFGPGYKKKFTVEKMIKIIKKKYPLLRYLILENYSGPVETSYLTLNIKKARNLLSYNPYLSFEDTLDKTLDWYKNFYDGADAYKLCINDIKNYEKKYKNN